jgi:hypothetical protein
MNRIFNGKLLAILIAGIALLGINAVSAKDYSVTAGNWKVDFNSNDTLYTDAVWEAPKDSTSTGYYTINIKEDPGSTTRASAIVPLDLDGPIPIGRDTMDYLMNSLYTSFNKTPLISDFIIDGTNGLVAEAWANDFGRTVYGALYPIEVRSDKTTTKIVSFISLLDKNTSFEIIKSMHVEYLSTQATSSALNSQSAQSLPTYSAQDVGTREKPVPMGTPVDLGDNWQITVMSVIPDATNVVLKENQFNNPPQPGNQFFLARIHAKYTGSGSDTFGGSYRLRAVGPSSVGYSTFENSAGVIPDPLPDSELFAGGVIEGNIGWEIKSSDADSLVMYDNPLSFGDSKDRMYMALYGLGPSASTLSYSNNNEWGTVGAGKMGRPASWQYK